MTQIKELVEALKTFGFIPVAVFMFFLGVARVAKLFESTPGERNGDVRGDGSPNPE